MYPEDRVLVAVLNRPQDLTIAKDEGWYRIPESKAGRSPFFEYLAFYCTAAFGDEKWGIHYYAQIVGHELGTRRELLPGEPDHPHADRRYYKLQLGPLQRREPPIISRRWRRVTFIYTTWDRFQAAQEINDLYAEGGEFVDRLYHALREAGLGPERCYPLREAGIEYLVPLAVPCRAGTLGVEIVDSDQGTPRPGVLQFTPKAVSRDLSGCLAVIEAAVGRQGGVLPWLQLDGKEPRS
jgi:hypothetical protein